MIGGGPAGASAAGLLASWGHDVVLVTRPTPPGGWLAESIPASARGLLEKTGVLDAVERAELFPNGGNTVWWAGREERRESFPDGTLGFHAEREALERALLAAAASTGARLINTAPVRRARRAEDRWTIEWGESTVEARWILDASGRTGVVARAGRVEDHGTATLALVGRWRSPSGWGDDATHTLIESHRDGWAWSVPISRELRCVTAMVDPRRTDLRRQSDLGVMLDAELEKTRHLLNRLSGTAADGPVRACSASLYSAEHYARDGVLLVGDAGSFIDPLSSYGVKKALASAWLAAVVCNTALTEEGAAAMATAFFDTREREVYRRYRSLSIPFLEEAAAAHSHPFWTARVDAARAAAGTGAPDHASRDDPADRLDPAEDADALVGRRAVRESYEEIRRRPKAEFLAARAADVVAAPVIRGRRVELAPHLTSASSPEPVRYIRNVDLCWLVEEAPRHDQVADLYDAYSVASGPVPLPDFLAALATAVGVGFLELSGWRPEAAHDTMG